MGANVDRGHSVVQVYIGYLRRKLDERVGEEVVQTVRGHDYRLCCGDEQGGTRASG